MSNVLAKDRKESGLEFLVFPHLLELYTIQHTKVIPKTHTFTLKVPLCESARNINRYITYANSIYPDNMKDKELKAKAIEERMKWEKRSIMEANNYYELLTVASETIEISNGILKEWTKHIMQTKQALIKRNNKDKERYS